MKQNKFQYEVVSGSVKGFFNIYQAKNGKLFLQLGNNVTELNIKQIYDLNIDVYSLKEFNYDLFKSVY